MTLLACARCDAPLAYSGGRGRPPKYCAAFCRQPQARPTPETRLTRSEPRQNPGPKPDLDRRERARALRLQGFTLQEIGDALGVTRERARQLIGPDVRRPPLLGPPVPSLPPGAATAAARLGIDPHEYQLHRENGQRWCCWHKAWESAQLFVRNRQNRDGLGGICRAGNVEQTRQLQGPAYDRDYYQRNREKIDAYHRQYRESHREQYRANHRAYYAAHRDEILARWRARYHAKRAAQRQEAAS